MDRKTFLGTLVALPVGVFLVSCNSSSNTPMAGTTNDSGTSNDPNAPAAPPMKNGTQNVYTSNDTGAPLHSHTFTIDDTSFTAPPSAGVMGDTSNVGGHTHAVSITMAQLAQVAAGQSVMVTASSVYNHVHVFTFVKIA